VRLRDVHGPHYLATLRREPGREFHASELARGSRAVLVAPVEATGSLRTGLGLGDAGERTDARSRAAYRERLADTEQELALVHPELGAHLSATARCGYFCSYVPDPRRPIEWNASPAC
jgi:hypothetical protein